jgi:glycosyltransferase involved in cell wall biosynthesis
MNRFFVVIPAFNAESTLRPLLQQVSTYLPPNQIIVVDDGSVDATRDIAAQMNVHVCVHRRNQGKGASLRTGCAFALAQNCDAVITMDADLQHAPSSIPDFIAAFETGQFDVVLGNRLKNLKGMPPHRILSNLITTALVRMRTDVAIADSQNGFRCIGRRVLERIHTEASGFEAETEFIIRAAKAGFRFGSVPVPTIYAGEKSSMTHWHTTVNFIHVLLKEY